MTYEESIRQLESIVQRMEQGDVSVDELTQQLKTAKNLISQCKAKLLKTDTEIKKILEKDK